MCAVDINAACDLWINLVNLMNKIREFTAYSLLAILCLEMSNHLHLFSRIVYNYQCFYYQPIEGYLKIVDV